MQYLLTILILVAIVTLGFVSPKSKISNILILFFIYSFFAFSYDEDDYLNYKGIYECVSSGEDSFFEPLYVWLMKQFSNLGVTFEGFRCIVSAIILIIIDLIVVKYTKYPNCVLALFLIYPSMYDATLIRFSLGMPFALFAICYLPTIQKWSGYLLYFICISIAALLHSSYWLMVFFVPLWLILNTKKGLYTVIIINISILFVVYLTSSILFSIYTLFVIKENALDTYNTGIHLNLLGLFEAILKYIILISPMLIYHKKSKKNNIKQECKNILENNIVKINVIFMSVLIPMFIASSYARFFHILILINYMFLFEQRYMFNWNIRKRKRFAISYAIILLFITILFENPETLDTIIKMHFNTNDILKHFS